MKLQMHALHVELVSVSARWRLYLKDHHTLSIRTLASTAERAHQCVAQLPSSKDKHPSLILNLRSSALQGIFFMV